MKSPMRVPRQKAAKTNWKRKRPKPAEEKWIIFVVFLLSKTGMEREGRHMQLGNRDPW